MVSVFLVSVSFSQFKNSLSFLWAKNFSKFFSQKFQFEFSKTVDFLNVSIDRFLSIQSPTRLKIKNHQTRGWIVIITALYRHHKGFHSGLISEGYHRSGWERRIMVKINTAGHWETDYDLGGALTDSSKLWMSDEIATLYKTSQDQGS